MKKNKVFQKKHFKQNSEEEKTKEVTLKINPLQVERTIYYLIILSLLIFSFFNPLSEYLKYKSKGCLSADIASENNSSLTKKLDKIFSFTKNTTEKVKKENLSAGNKNLSAEETKGNASKTQSKNHKAKNTNSTNTLSNASVKPGTNKQTASTSKDILLTISSLSVEDKITYKKIEGVKVNLRNNGNSTFYPRIKIFLYDELTKNIGDRILRGEGRFDIGIKQGSSESINIILSKPTSFSSEIDGIYVKVILENLDGKVYKSIVKYFKLKDLN